MEYTQNYLDVILLGGVLVVAAIYLIAKSDCKF